MPLPTTIVEAFISAKATSTKPLAITTRRSGSTQNLLLLITIGGLAYHDQRDFEKAISDYTEAIRLDPNYAMAYDNRG